MVKYFDIVQLAYHLFLGSVWLCFDEMFRIRAAMDPPSPWDGKNTEIWTELVTQDRQQVGPTQTAGIYWQRGSGGCCQYRSRTCAGNVMPKCLASVFGPLAGSGMNVWFVWEPQPTLAQRALEVVDLKETGQESQEVSVEDIHIQVQKAPTPVCRGPLLNWLSIYPKKAVALYLADGFTNGFRIPFEGVRKHTQEGELISIIGKVKIVKDIHLKRARYRENIGPFQNVAYMSLEDFAPKGPG